MDRYENSIFIGLGITLYGVKENEDDMDIPSNEAVKNGLWEIMSKPGKMDIGIKDALLSDNSSVLISPPKPKVSEVVRFSPGSYIAVCKPDRGKSTFISADIETICIDNVHVPYAMGYVFMGSNEPVTYCTESPYYTGSFVERSRSMFYEFFSGLLSYSASYRTKKIYFHNLSRFDGILLLRLLIDIEESRLIIKPGNIVCIKYLSIRRVTQKRCYLTSGIPSNQTLAR